MSLTSSKFRLIRLVTDHFRQDLGTINATTSLSSAALLKKGILKELFLPKGGLEMVRSKVFDSSSSKKLPFWTLGWSGSMSKLVTLLAPWARTASTKDPEPPAGSRTLLPAIGPMTDSSSAIRLTASVRYKTVPCRLLGYYPVLAGQQFQGASI